MTTTQARRIATHERQITRLAVRLSDLNKQHARFIRWRLGVFLTGIPLIVLAFNLSSALGWLATALWAVVFGVLIYYHRRIQHAIARFSIWQRLKYETLARMKLQWEALPKTEPAPAHLPAHPFALDLDIVGEHSLYRLLDTAVSSGGSARLRDWLLNTQPDAAAIARRQTLVREIMPQILFRDRLALAVRLTGRHERWHGDRVFEWLRAESGNTVSGTGLAMLVGLAAVNLSLLLLDGLDVLPSLWIGSLLLYWAVMGTMMRGMGDLFGQSLTLQSEIERLSAALSSLEAYRYRRGSRLEALCRPITDSKPSAALCGIRWIVAAISLARNVFLWFWVNTLFPWDMMFAFLLQRSKRRLVQLLPLWLDVLYEVEALNSLAHFAYMNPAYPFPTLTDSASLIGGQIGHPLIPAEVRVCNDFSIQQGHVGIITGSNMSGKSSFLRAVGMNLVLLYAGGVVCADALETGLFRVFTCIKVSDSVVDGISYFYAEVKRLKALLNALQAPHDIPLFFLIDEIFRGTNNRERLIGSRAYIQALAGGHGCGLISTHDLELITLADLTSLIHNYHFREQIEDGRMVFDYRLRTGGSPTTNALKIMEIEGLPVPYAEVESEK